MGKLDDLKNMVATMFANATQKEDIENLAKLNNVISEVEKENSDLLDKNTELIKSYKELVKHTSFKEKPVEVTQPSGEPLSLEDHLKEFMAKQEKNS